MRNAANLERSTSLMAGQLLLPLSFPLALHHFDHSGSGNNGADIGQGACLLAL